VIVVDCSALVDALLVAPATGELRAYIALEDLHAPAVLDVEVVSAARGLVLGGRLSLARAEDLLTDFDDLPIRRWAFADGLRRRALQMRDTVSAYDAAYVSLAEALDCPLLTRDARLARSAGHDARIELR
jgi:predicted nucleic acid-binding protein